VLAVKRELLAARPELAEAFYSLFAQSLAAGDHEIGHHSAQYLPLADMQWDAINSTLGPGWNGYGWARNEKTIRVFCEQAVKQGFVNSVAIDSIFRAMH
jgi:hypothetical protein